ncbi:hypothetical protein Tco_0851253 [Tanacetum coccineum]
MKFTNKWKFSSTTYSITTIIVCVIKNNYLRLGIDVDLKLGLLQEPLSPKLLRNREAHVDYLKHTREHADTLCEIVEHDRALRPLDSDLDSACKYATRVHELLVYVQDTCPGSSTKSKKLIAVTPTIKVKNVRRNQFY